MESQSDICSLLVCVLCICDQCLNSGGTSGNAVPVRKLQPHLEETLVPLKPADLLTVSSACSNCRMWLTAICVSEFPCFSVILKTDYVHLCMTISLTPLSRPLEFPYQENYSLSSVHDFLMLIAYIRECKSKDL